MPRLITCLCPDAIATLPSSPRRLSPARAAARVAGLALIVAAVALSPARAKTIAQAPVAITVDRTAAGVALPADFSGFSYEVKVLLPGADGVRYFRADNPRLLALFRTLGIGSLRIGGNTSDRDARELPKQADLDSLFAFAQAANVKVIYCLRLRNGDATAATATVKYIMDHYAPLVDSFSIGQEPSAYPVEKVDTRPAGERMGAAVEKFPYASYRDQWKTFADAIIAAVPNVRFCGPSVHNNGTWARRFIADFGTGHHVALVTEHLYAGGAGQKLASAEIGRDRMLSDDFTRAYQKLYDSFVPDAKAAGLPFRLEEANSYFNGGALGASNTYSSALWGLDFMFWWAAHGAAGLNFHTGDRVSMNNDFQAPRYAAFVSKADGFEVRPLAYAIKAYNLGARGRIVPVNVTNPANLNVTAYAAIAPDGAVFLTIINREHGAEAQEATVVLNGFNANAPARALWLRQEASDVAATTGVTLGGAPITSAGAWKGNWEPLASGTESRSVKIPAASAVIVELK